MKRLVIAVDFALLAYIEHTHKTVTLGSNSVTGNLMRLHSRNNVAPKNPHNIRQIFGQGYVAVNGVLRIALKRRFANRYIILTNIKIHCYLSFYTFQLIYMNRKKGI